MSTFTRLSCVARIAEAFPAPDYDVTSDGCVRTTFASRKWCADGHVHEHCPQQEAVRFQLEDATSPETLTSIIEQIRVLLPAKPE